MIYVNEEKIELNQYPDGTLLMKLATLSEQIELKWFYENDAELFALICATKHLRRINPSISLSLFLPYIPHSRMDRVYENCDVFTLKYFAEIINSLGFNKVTVLDPHSNVSAALIDNIHIISPISYINQVIQLIQTTDGETPVLYYPDSNAAKNIARFLLCPIAMVIKSVIGLTVKLLGLILLITQMILTSETS